MKKMNFPRIINRYDSSQPIGQVKLGVMKTSLINFISPPIIFFFTAITGVILWGFETIHHFFVAGEVQLNSLICMGIFYSLGRILMNLILLYRTAGFLKRVDKVSEKENITDSDINRLEHELQKSGSLVDTKNMADALARMRVHGHLQFTDNDARLIKSKVGQRTNHNRTAVGFLGGLLIMMGLLGTYLGLLETIDEVGKAMAGMANIGGSGSGAAAAGDGGGLSDDQMSGFIGSIAAPLQGMGLAFSASLFGIGGSLIVSFFNYLSGHSQNHFIENVSRWIDERIPAPGQKAKGAKDNAAIPGSDDLKAWLASFAYLSQKTHKKLGQLTLVMSQTVATIVNQKNQTELMGQRQEEMCSSLKALGTHVEDFKNNSQGASLKSEELLKNLEKSLSNVVTQAISLKDINQNMSGHVSMLNQKVESLQSGIRESSAEVSQDIKSMRRSFEDQQPDTKTFTSSLEGLKSTLQGLSTIQQDLSQNLGALKKNAVNQNEVEISNLVWQLNSLLEDLNKKNDGQLEDIFKKPAKDAL